MIILSAKQQALLQDPLAEKFYCVRIKNILLTDFYRDLNIADGYYVSSNLLAGVTPPKMSSSVDRSLYEVVLTDSNNTLLGLYETGLVGALLRVQVGFVDPVSELPEVDELFTIYEGVVQGFDSNFDTAVTGEVVSKLTGSNPLAALDASSSFYTSREMLREVNATDSAFDQIYEGSKSLNLLWGKN